MARYRAALGERPPGAALWLAPTWRAASEVRERILDGSLPGCFRPGVMTFENFAEAVLHAAELPIRPMTRLMKRELVRQILAEQSSRGRLGHFQSIANTTGLVDLVCEFISELKRLEIWPDEFRRACQARGLAEKDTELSEIYDVYQNALREHGLFDAEGRFWSARDVLARGERRGERGEGGLGTSVTGAVGSGQSAVGSRQWAVGSGQSAVGSRQSAVGSGQSAVGSGQSAVGGGQSAVGSEESRSSRSTINNQQSAIFPLSPLSSLLSPLSLVVADGFTDFTRTQHEILEILARRCEEMFVTLPLEAEPRRNDLFAKPLKTLDELRRRHRGATVEQLGRTTEPAWPALAQLERTVFENPRKRRREEGQTRRRGVAKSQRSDGLAPPEPPVSPSASLPLSPSAFSAAHIEILAAARQVGEIEMIARRIKRLLVDGDARPGDIAVVFRSPQDSAELIDEVFSRLGIPFKQESGSTLDHSPALRSLVALLQLDLDDWPFDRLLAVLGSNYFQPGWRGDSAAVEQTIRQLQVPRGRKSLIEQLGSKERGASDRRQTPGGRV